MFCQVYSNIFNWNQGINELKRVYLSSYSEICIFFFSFRFYFLAPCVIPHFLLSLQTLGLQSQLITPSLLEKWHTYPRDCKLAEIDCRVLEISKLAYVVITFYSENSNKKKKENVLLYESWLNLQLFLAIRSWFLATILTSGIKRYLYYLHFLISSPILPASFDLLSPTKETVWRSRGFPYEEVQQKVAQTWWWHGRARVAQWWEHSPPTNVARVQIPASTPYDSIQSDRLFLTFVSSVRLKSWCVLLLEPQKITLLASSTFLSSLINHATYVGSISCARYFVAVYYAS